MLPPECISRCISEDDTNFATLTTTESTQAA